MSSVEFFDFMGDKVRVVLVDDEPWFVLRDVANILGYVSTAKAKTHLSDDETNVPNRNVALELGQQGGRLPLLVSEPGLNRLIMRSNDRMYLSNGQEVDL